MILFLEVGRLFLQRGALTGRVRLLKKLEGGVFIRKEILTGTNVLNRSPR